MQFRVSIVDTHLQRRLNLTIVYSVNRFNVVYNVVVLVQPIYQGFGSLGPLF